MTLRAFLLVVLAFLLALAGLAWRQGAVLALILPILIYLGVAVWNRPAPLQLASRRELDRVKVFPDTPIESRVTIQNNGQFVEELELHDDLPQGLVTLDGKLHQITSLAPQEETEIFHTSKGQRGEYIFADVKARAVETFGLFEMRAAASTPERLSILPAVMRMRPISIRPLQTRGFAGPIPSRQGGAGIEFFLVREYQPGDPMRQINWNVSARHEREIFTTTYELQRIADVGIILDARQQTDVRRGKERIFEYSVRAAGGLADLFLQDGNRVGMLVYGAAITSAFPGMGKLQRERILQVLARAETGFSYALEKLDYLPTRFFPPRSQIILVSPLVNADIPVLGYLRQQGYSVLVVSPNAILFEGGHEASTSVDFLAQRIALAERKMMINSLRRHGVLVADWDVTTPLEPLVRSTASAAIHRPAEMSV
jgi:uncharacterized protein (DUF58 family)